MTKMKYMELTVRIQMYMVGMCDCIEGNSIVELYIRMYVQRNSNDTSRNVPGGLIKCQFWAE